MHWRQDDPVQGVDALLLTGVGAAERLRAALDRRAEFVRNLPVASGAGWAAIFARAMPGENDTMLPRLDGARPLYSAGEGWWFPVGTELAVPPHAQATLLRHFAKISGFSPPVIVVPRFGNRPTSGDVDVYPVFLNIRETLV